MTAKIPTEIKRKKGTLRKCRENKSEPAPELKDSGPVGDIIKNSNGDYRAYVVEMLERVGVMSEMDATTVDALAATYQEWLGLNNYINNELEGKTSYWSVTQTGSEICKPYPEYTMRADAANRLLKLLQNCGMTPSSRQSVSANLGNKKEENPFKNLKVV